jgi:aspartyl-tRNA(Asn)/glutamyl-tRNA(Gln) amidotransferase subunit C
MALSAAEVQKVARLARMRLTDPEQEQMRSQLSRILDYIAMLEEVDVSGVAPTAQVTDLISVLRPDAARPSLTVEEVLQNAPDQRENMFRVKGIFEES